MKKCFLLGNARRKIFLFHGRCSLRDPAINGEKKTKADCNNFYGVCKKETKELTVGISACLTPTMWVQWREQLVRMCCSPLLGSLYLYLYLYLYICICICMSEKYNSRGCAAPPCWVLGSGRGQPLAPAGDTSDQLGKIRIHPNIQLVSLIQPSSRSDTFIPPFKHKDISLSTQHYYCAVPQSIFTDVWAYYTE